LRLDRLIDLPVKAGLATAQWTRPHWPLGAYA
jgi:hypothetical protein